MSSIHQRAISLDQRLAAIKADEPVRKQFAGVVGTKAIDAEARTARFVITTGSVDRDNDTIDPTGWDLKAFLKSPSILWAHDYSQLPVARATDITMTANGLESTAQFPPKGVYPFADTVFDLLQGGFLNATSVGFRPTEFERNDARGGLDFAKQELLEYSIVPVPANAEALIIARSKGIDLAPLDDWAQRVLKSRATPAAKVAKGALSQLRKAVHKDAISSAATTVDSMIDSLDVAFDALLGALGLPDLPEPDDLPNGGMPSAQLVSGGAGGDTATGLPRSAKAPLNCPACGTPIPDSTEQCPGCGWMSPDGEPHTLPYFTGSARRWKFAPAFVKVAGNGERWRTFRPEGDDPLRWNRQLSKAFDVAGEPLEPSTLEYTWVSRYLETPVQQLSVEEVFVPSARMGSWLSALDEGLGAWTVDACRSMTENGREVPPEYETIQLNSTTARSFLVQGLRFMRRADGAKLVMNIARHWSGLYARTYVRHEQAQVRADWVQRIQQRASELNFLKGEAFTLSGEFLDRGSLDWPALFMEPAQEQVLRRTVERLNELGAEMPSRGLMLMGPPGTGKTLSGRVMMAQAKTTFVWISARDFYRSGAYGAFTYAFDIAAECAPTILFFEDVDNWITGYEVDLLKTEMDGLKRRKGVETILTTNFPELIPDALIDRPGRFHDLMELDLPSEAVRQRMLTAWAPTADPQDIAALAQDTAGMSGAHLRELTEFALTIGKEENLGVGPALRRALTKLQEQRELVASLREAPDYRPRRAVRAAVGAALGLVQKRGRVLSATNEGLIRNAHESLQQVLGKLDTQPPPSDDTGDDAGIQERSIAIILDGEVEDESEPVLELSDAREPEFALAGSEARAITRGLIGEVLGTLVREQTQAALARARGRVD